MALLERQTASLRKFHPKAQMWMSPQGFTAHGWTSSTRSCKSNPPGSPASSSARRCATPCRCCAAQSRRAISIRRYPDITHSLRASTRCRDWDVAHALTSQPRADQPAARSIRPRSSGAAAGIAIGFITYSEGCNDDVNKIVWSGLGWDPEGDGRCRPLRQYGRYFIGDRYADPLRPGASGARARTGGARSPTTPAWRRRCEQFQAMERSAAPRDLLNWRFQQALYRAYYDAYVRQPPAARDGARGAARSSGLAQRPGGSARARCAEAERSCEAPRRSRSRRLADARLRAGRGALPEHPACSCSVAAYRAIAVGRGATLDTDRRRR